MYEISQDRQIVTTWGNRIALQNSITPFLDRVFFKDIGVGGSEWFWDDGTSSGGGGTARWRAVGGQVVLKNDTTGTASVANTVTTSQLMLAYTFPLGLIQKNDVIQLTVTRAKNAADLTNSFQSLIYFGKLGTTSDPFNQVVSLAGGNINSRSAQEIKITSVNTVQLLMGGASNGLDATTVLPNGNANPTTGQPSMSATQTGILTSNQILGVYGRWNVTAAANAVGYLLDMQIILKTCGA